MSLCANQCVCLCQSVPASANARAPLAHVTASGRYCALQVIVSAGRSSITQVFGSCSSASQAMTQVSWNARARACECGHALTHTHTHTHTHTLGSTRPGRKARRTQRDPGLNLRTELICFFPGNRVRTCALMIKLCSKYT